MTQGISISYRLACFFYAENEEKAQRVAQAFKNLITQCGGKPDVKNIY
jgi:hypothetical protein